MGLAAVFNSMTTGVAGELIPCQLSQPMPQGICQSNPSCLRLLGGEIKEQSSDPPLLPWGHLE